MTEQEWLTSTNPAAMLRYPLLAAEFRNQHAGRYASDRKLRLFATACCHLVWDKLTDPRSRRAVEVAERFADGEATSKERGQAMNAADLIASPTCAYAAMACLRANAAQGASEAVQFLSEFGAAAQAALLREIFGNPYRPVTLPRTAIPCAECRLPGNYCRLCFGTAFMAGPSPWLTPNVLTLAKAAYGGERCEACKGAGDVLLRERKPDLAIGPKDRRRLHCPDCAGSGRTPFDAASLPILADALEDAGCTDEAMLMHLRGKERAFTEDCYVHYEHGMGWRPLATPHVRGCWALDFVLGKQ